MILTAILREERAFKLVLSKNLLKIADHAVAVVFFFRTIPQAELHQFEKLSYCNIEPIVKINRKVLYGIAFDKELLFYGLRQTKG